VLTTPTPQYAGLERINQYKVSKAGERVAKEHLGAAIVRARLMTYFRDEAECWIGCILALRHGAIGWPGGSSKYSNSLLSLWVFRASL